MNLKRLAPLLLLLILVCPNCFGQELSHDELVEILGIKSWRIPSLKNENREWGIRIVDYEPRKYTNTFNAEQLDAQKKSLIVLRDLGDNIYRFFLKQRTGTNQGELKIDLCAGHSKDEVCDASYVIEFYDTPKPFDDGTKFLIGEINQMVQRKSKKQIILEAYKIRPE